LILWKNEYNSIILLNSQWGLKTPTCPSFLTPKSPTCFFWHRRHFGQVHVTGDLHTYGWNLIEGKDEQSLSCALNFITFGNTNQKLWPNMFLFLVKGQSNRPEKITFFINKIGFLELYVRRNLGIIPFWSMSHKLQGVLVCRQLWILYSKINI